MGGVVTVAKKKPKKKKPASKKTRKTRKNQPVEDPAGKRFVDIAVVAMLLLAAYFAIFGGDYTVFDIGNIETLESERAAELAQTQAEIDSLQSVVAILESDPEAIERVAREDYGMIRDGEILYRFREVVADTTDTTETGGGQPPNPR
jgi:cell division protein FtsB